MLQLNEEDLKDLWSLFATTNVSSMSRTNPYVFTEQGVYMLAKVLRNEMLLNKK